MTTPNTTTAEIDDRKEVFYKEMEKYTAALSERFRNKCVIKRGIYDNIITCLSLLKGVSCSSKCHSKAGPCKNMGD